jgi:predicted nucleotidyltransferase
MKAHEIPQSVRLALEELKGALVEVYGERPEGVYLYGSYARGDFTGGFLPSKPVSLVQALES